MPRKQKSIKLSALRADKVKPTIYDRTTGAGLRSWRLWGKRGGQLIEIGRVASFFPETPLELARKRAKPYGKRFFSGFTVEDITQP